jgi:hypothetical protein
MFSRLSRYAIMSVIIPLCLATLVIQARADALADLNKAFLDAYGLAASQSLVELRRAAPIFVNRFEQIVLYRPGVDQPDIFSMDVTIYNQTRSVAHTVVALNARLAPFGLGRLDVERLNWLANYDGLLTRAMDELTIRSDIPGDLKADQLKVLSTVRGVVQRIYQRGEVDQVILDELSSTVRPSISRLIMAAAASQLEQFRDQIARWKVRYPTLAWRRAVVVVIGVHQARENDLQRQFFDWLLDDRPSKQERVVFAETLTFPPPLENAPATDAMMLLAKVMLDKTISTSIFGDPLALQSDVLGGAAEDIIRRWPPP